MMRDEVLGSVAQVGAGMSELRLDAHLDAVQAIARYMDLIKLAYLMERRPREEELAGSIGEINQVLAQVLSPEQREIFLASNLDSVLLESERETAQVSTKPRRALGAPTGRSEASSKAVRRSPSSRHRSATDPFVCRWGPCRFNRRNWPSGPSCF